MIYLIGSIIFSAILNIAFKIFPRFEIDNLQAIIVNYFTCVLTGFIVTGYHPIKTDTLSEPWFPLAFVLGLLFITVFNLVAYSVQKIGVSIITVSQKIATVITVLYLILFLAESAALVKILGIIGTFIAIVLINHPFKNTEKNLSSRWLLFLPLIVFISGGIIEIVIFTIEHNGYVGKGNVAYVSLVFLTAGIFGTLFLLAKNIVNKSWTKFKWKNILAGVLLGVPNYFSMYYLVKLLNLGWEGSTIYPINNIFIILLTVLVGYFAFSEKLNKYNLIGFVIALISIYLISQ